MDRVDMIARLEYWQNQEVDAYFRVEECRQRAAEVLAEIALVEMHMGPDELP